MALEFNDGKITGSSGVAKAGLTLGIIGTGLAALGGNGLLGGLFGNSAGTFDIVEKYAGMQSTIDQLKAQQYSDANVFDLYKEIVKTGESADAKIGAVQTQLYNAVLDLDKRTALNEQAARLNREYDATVRDYMMTIVNNKIDCCCEKMTMKADYEKQISELADASIISYVNSNFLPGIFEIFNFIWKVISIMIIIYKIKNFITDIVSNI